MAPFVDYAIADPARRLSKLAVVALLLPLVGLPALIAASGRMHELFSPTHAEFFGWLGMVTISTAGVFTAIISYRRVRASEGRMRGRPIAVVAFAINVVLTAMAVLIFFVDSDIRW
jgi:hypothetical protein